MTALEWLAQPASRLVTLSLLHFLWQGLCICLLLVVVVELLHLRRATTRYACSLVALLAITICPLVTLIWLAVETPANTAAEFSVSTISLGSMRGPHWLEAAQPAALAVWLMGVVAFGSRLLAGAVGISLLRRSRIPLPPKMAAAVQRLGHRLRIEATSLVFLSKQAADAMAVGLVRPLVLIPAAWATEMPLPMLEAVIAHELAHLVRRDLWVNLLQRIVETLLFYHPAVWWLSRRLRIERELCADELAVAATGDRVAYVQALEHIASGQQADIRPALAAFLRGETDMRLLQRVRNVLGKPTEERSRLWPAGVIALALPLGMWAAATVGGVAVADDDDEDRNKPVIKRDREGGNLERRIELRRKPRDGESQEIVEDRIVQLKFDKPKREEIVEERVIKRDGKPVVEVQLGRKELREDQGDRRIDELTALVKKLAGQVERLQDEVAQLRGSSASDRRVRVRDEEEARARQSEAEARLRASEAVARRRAIEQDREKELYARELAEKKETVQRELERMKKELAQKPEFELKEKAARIDKEKLEAAREKAEAAREKAEEAKEKARKAIEDKIRKLKEDSDGDEEETEALTKKLFDDAKALNLFSPGDKPRIKVGK